MYACIEGELACKDQVPSVVGHLICASVTYDTAAARSMHGFEVYSWLIDMMLKNHRASKYYGNHTAIIRVRRLSSTKWPQGGPFTYMV